MTDDEPTILKFRPQQQPRYPRLAPGTSPGYGSFLCFAWGYSRGFWRLTVFGFGLTWHDTRKCPLLYTERKPRWDAVTWGHWRFRVKFPWCDW